MKSFKFGFARPTLASLALLTLLGTSASAAPLQWTVLQLLNGWIIYSVDVRRPTAAIDADGIVHLRGAMRQATGINPTAFVLPANMRPNKPVYVVTNLYQSAPGRLVIYPDGQVFAAANGPPSDAQQFTSLEGVTFSKY